jgi:DNA primase
LSEKKKVNIIVDALGRYYVSGEEYIFKCKFCNHHKRKLSVNIAKNKYKCWICETSGNDVRRLVRKFGSRNDLAEWDKLTNRTNILDFDTLFGEKEEEQTVRINLPREFTSLVGGKETHDSKQVRKYLKSRGVSSDDIRDWKIGYCTSGEYAGRVMVPSFDDKGYLNYFVGRAYGTAFPKYKNPPVSKNIVFNHLIWAKDIILVEGVFDAIVAGSNSIPILGSYIKEDGKLFQEIVNHGSTVYLALDPDAEKKTKKIIEKLLSYDIEVYKIDILPYTDVGEMTRKEFLQRKQNAVFLNNKNYLLYEAINSL